jgi:hypothetical protein
MRITRDRMIDILGPAPKPRQVWQRQFDGHDAKLAELAQLDWDKVPASELWYYIHDLAYMELQPDLFGHLFPACLKFWCDTLRSGEPAARGDAELHYALLHGQVLDTHLNETQRNAVYALFRDGMLDRIEAERGFVYLRRTADPISSDGVAANGWIYRLNTLGLVAPVIPEIWNEWWRLDHPGKAVSAVIYSLGLVYDESRNPVFPPWNPESGGGGPYLHDNDSYLHDRGWREDNLAFLRETLSAGYVLEKLRQAAAVLAQEPEGATAALVAGDAESCQDELQIRIDDLLAKFASGS